MGTGMDRQSAEKFHDDHQPTDEDKRCFAYEREKREAGIAGHAPISASASPGVRSASWPEAAR